MAVPTEALRPFRLYVTYLASDGPLLKVCGQVDKQSASLVKSLIEASSESFDNGLGAAPATAIIEGIICVAKYKDGSYYRAKVLSTSNLNNGLIMVHFVDYGHRDLVSLSTVRLLESNNPLLQIRGQASDYYLARIVSQASKWEEPIILKLRNWLCFTEYKACVEVQTYSLPIISIEFQRSDLSLHLASNRYGMTVPIEQQEVLLLTMSDNRTQSNNWPEYSSNDTSSYTSQIPYMNNQSYSTAPPPTMHMQQGLPPATLQNTYSQQPTSAINQRLLAHKTMRTPAVAALRTIVRQAPQNTSLTQAAEPSAIVTKNPSSPKKLVTYKTRTLEINSTHKVSVSYVENGATNFAVQLLSDAKQLKEMMSEINKRPYRSLSESPTIGEVCLGRFSDDRIISRAIVSNVSNLGCKLYFVDFGDEELVQYYDIFNLPEQFLQHPVFAMKICLSGLKNLNWTTKLDEAFKSLVNDKILTLKVVPAEGPPLVQYGELYYNNMNILELLLSSEQAAYLEFQTLPILPPGYKESVLVSYVDSCLKFFVQLSSNIDELNAVMNAVKVHCEQSVSPGELAPGKACCARFPDDSNWYRAKVIEAKGQRVVVAYVDYGNEQEVHVNDLRSITNNLIQLPAQAMKCALKGFENKPVESKTSNQLEMLALEKTLMAHVAGSLSDDTMLLTLIDESVSPPLDVARKMTQLSTPRSNPEKVTTPIRKDTPNNSFSSPDAESSEDRRRNSYRREKSFKEDHRPRDTQDTFKPRGGSFRGKDRDNKENFERGDAGRHSEKSGRQDYGERRGAGKPWENKEQSPKAEDDWAESSPVVSKDRRKSKVEYQIDKTKSGWKSKHEGSKQRLRSTDDTAPIETNPSSAQDRLRRDNNSFDGQRNKYEKKFDRKNDRESRGERSFGDKNYGEKRYGEKSYGDKSYVDKPYGDKSYGEKKYGDKKEWKDKSQRGGRSAYSPRDRAERSFDKESQHSYGSDKSRTKPVLKDVPDPAPDDAVYADQDLQGAALDVAVSWFTSPDSFYVQPLSLQPALEDMMREIPELYRGVRSGVGQARAVLARYPADRALYRADVLERRPPGRLLVRYVDFGNKALVADTDVWRLTADLLRLPRQAVHCALAGVRAKPGVDRAALDQCFGAERYVCIGGAALPDGRRSVTLTAPDGSDVAATLLAKQLADAEQEAAPAPPPPAPAAPAIGTPHYVAHVDSPGQFWLHTFEDADRLERLQEELAARAETFPPLEECGPGARGCARYSADERWYRAEVLDADADITTVRFVDYGNTDVLGPAALRRLPDELAAPEPLALRCKLHAAPGGTGEWSEAAADRFAELLLAVPEVDTRVLLGGATLCVELRADGVDPAAVLVAEGLASADREAREPCFASHVGSPDEFWIQLESATSELQEIEEAMAAALSFPVLEAAEEGALVAAEFPEDGAWYRARVAARGSEGTEVLFVDYGNSCMASELRALPAELSARPALSRKCALRRGRAGKWGRRAEARFEEMAAEGATVFGVRFVASGDLSVVDLYLAESSVADELLALENDEQTDTQANVSPNETSQSEIPQTEVQETEDSQIAISQIEVSPSQIEISQTERPPPVGQVARAEGHVCYVHSTDEFYVQYNDISDELDKIVNELEKSESFEIIPELKIGTLCATFSSEYEQWYRAKILEFCDVGAHVHFVDYGNKSKCEEFRQLPDELSSIEPLAKCYRLAGIDKPSNEIYKNKFENLILDDAPFQIEFIDSVQEPNLVRLYLNEEDVANILISSGPEIEENDNVANKAIDLESTENDVNDDNDPENADLNESIESNITVIDSKLNDTINDIIDETTSKAEDEQENTDVNQSGNIVSTEVNTINDTESTNVILENGDLKEKQNKEVTDTKLSETVNDIGVSESNNEPTLPDNNN